ncbi:MAG: LysM peptidoglycan-binding domain-containing protein [Planctomycetota bacterium]|jgi:nucleoid-associated protein YgaU
MGSFEKLGILVIVVIIVMILAVAVYQWGGDGSVAEYPIMEPRAEEPLIVDLDEEEVARPQVPKLLVPPAKPAEASTAWPGGIPRRYQIQRDDNLWDLVRKEWKLRESFIGEVKSANPGVNWKRLMPGKMLIIPDPTGFAKGERSPRPAEKASATRTYRIQEGDTLELIARKHLGAKSRWREIAALNPEVEAKRLRPGQKIRIPVR